MDPDPGARSGDKGFPPPFSELIHPGLSSSALSGPASGPNYELALVSTSFVMDLGCLSSLGTEKGRRLSRGGGAFPPTPAQHSGATARPAGRPAAPGHRFRLWAARCGVPGPQGLGGADLLQPFAGAGSVRCAAAAPRSAPPGLGRREEAPLGAVYVLLQFGKDRVFPGRSPAQLCRPWDVSFPFPSRRNSVSEPSVGKGARHPWFVVTLKYVSKASAPKRAG